MTAFSGAGVSHVRVPSPPPGFVEFRLEELDQAIPARFEQQVARFPDRAAVQAGGRTLTYHGLNHAANRVARAILAERGTAGEPVVLVVAHPAAAVTGILGILKAGKTVVPVEASYPATRLARIVEHSEARTLVVDGAMRTVARSLSIRHRGVIDIDALEGVSGDNIGLPISPSAIERIVYTSGSTGHPKGVFRTHRAAMHTIMLFTNSICVCPDDRLLLLFSHTHGAGLNGLFTALLNGAGVVLFDARRDGLAELADVMSRDVITLYYSVPTVFRTFAESLPPGARFPSLRLIDLSGEPVSRHDVDLYRRIAPPQCVLRNHLGSSEAGFHRWYFLDKQTEIDGGVVPAGYAVPTVTTTVVDDDGHEVECGEIGEIAVQSQYLECGYWRDPELTRRVFTPVTGRHGARMYRTGDLGRMLADGCLVCLGRKDSQIKIRGHRVEPAETEAALRGHPAVKDAAVAGRADPASGDVRLVAYVVPHGLPPSAVELRDAILGILPQYMAPAAFVFLETLPTLPNGKVDYRALPAPAWDGARRRDDAVPPRTLERRLAQIWENVLGIGYVAPGDNFFELGGDSLTAARILHRIEETWGRRLRLSTFLKDATVEHLADLVRDVHPPSSAGE